MRTAFLHAPDRDEPSPSLRLHARIAELEHPKSRVEVHLHLREHRLTRHFTPLQIRLDGRIADENVGRRGESVENVLDGLGVAEVSDRLLRLRVELLRQGERLLKRGGLARAVHDDMRTELGEAERDGAANAACRPRDKRRATREIEFLLQHQKYPPFAVI